MRQKKTPMLETAAPLDIEARIASMMAEAERLRSEAEAAKAEAAAAKAEAERIKAEAEAAKPQPGGFVVIPTAKLSEKERKHTFARGEQIIEGGNRVKIDVKPGGTYSALNVNERWFKTKAGGWDRTRGIELESLTLADVLLWAIENPEPVKSWVRFIVDNSEAAAKTSA